VLVAASFESVPPGAGALLDPAAAVAAVAACLALGIQLGAPVIAVVWVANILLALLARLAPRMNAFFAIGHPITTTLGVAILAASLPWILEVHHQAVRAAVEQLGRP
jgi:flagellar biosynthetic protein FliR